MTDNTPRTSAQNLPFPCADDLIATVNSKLDRGNPALGYIYLIESKCGTSVKIGRSVNPSKRIAHIEKAAGGVGRSFVSERVCDAVSIEITLHRAFFDCRLKGEWFAVDFHAALQIVKSVCDSFLATQDDIARAKANEEAGLEKARLFGEQILGDFPKPKASSRAPSDHAHQSRRAAGQAESRTSLVRINSIEVHPVVIRGQRVLTLAQIDKVHGRPEGTARRNFTKNKARLIEGDDFFVVEQPDEIRTLGLARADGSTPEKITLVTESGYLLLVKSFTDDLAWQVQRELVNAYFRCQTPIDTTPLEEGVHRVLEVEFQGDTLYLIDADGTPYVHAESIRAGSRLPWYPTRHELRVLYEPLLKTLAVRFPDGAVVPMHECLPLRKLPGWLAKGFMHYGRFEYRSPEYLRLRAYFDHADDALWDAWDAYQRRMPPARPDVDGAEWVTIPREDLRRMTTSIAALNVLLDRGMESIASVEELTGELWYGRPKGTTLQ